jgi:hypothetical protein
MIRARTDRDKSAFMPSGTVLAIVVPILGCFSSLQPRHCRPLWSQSVNFLLALAITTYTYKHMAYYMNLNKALLLFFPSSDALIQSHVVQVIIKTVRYVHWLLFFKYIYKYSKENQIISVPTVGVLASFFLAQADITVRVLLPVPL